MRVTPRKTEIASVVALLESKDYDTADALAKDIIKQMADLFAEREWYAHAWRTGPDAPVLAWGPLPSQSEAEKFAIKAGLGGENIVVKLFSSASMLDRIEKGEAGLQKYCITCTHPLGAHTHPMMGNRCAVGGCSCQAATK